MRSDYGNLRRRTRDSGWQWVLVGAFMGIGLAMVFCVGGYAVGAITFPFLEEDTATPRVVVEPNQTEVALQATAAQQTLQAAQQTLAPTTPEVPAVDTGQGQSDTPRAAETLATPTLTPSPLPNGEETTTGDSQPDGGAATAPSAQTPAPTQAGSQPEVVAMPDQGTPIVGTPPVGTPDAPLALPGGATISPELDSLKTDMVPVTGGTYMMGTTLEEANKAMDECALYGTTCDDLTWVSDSVPPHPTTVDSFQMEVYEVSVAQYVAFLNWLGPNGHKTGCQGQPCAFTTLEKPDQSYVAFDGTTYTVVNPDFYSNHPATFVTWWGADEYCRAINRRLPTEAEWERAARGSANNVYPWGFEFDPNRAMSSYPTAIGTMPVNEFPNGASPYGVFNLSGNVSEWVWDWYQGDYYTQQLNSPQPNPNGPISGTERVHRGGSWDTKPLFLRAVHRLSRAPGDPTSSIGFRCVADTRPVTQPVVPPAGDNQSGSDSAAPTLPPQPTLIPQPTSTPSGPTPTLNPG